jgi:hypothetical protein
MMRLGMIALSGLAMCVCAAPAAAQPIDFGPDLAAKGWKTLNFRALPPALFVAQGSSRLDIAADSAASVIWLGLDEASWARQAASWRWRVEVGPPAANLAAKGQDDRAIALYFVFARDEAAARSALGAQSLTSAIWWSSGAAIVYVWGGAGARDAVVPSPHMGANGKLILRQPAGADGRWRAETAQIRADFQRAFGREPGPLVGIAVSSDSDDTRTRTRASIEGLRLD